MIYEFIETANGDKVLRATDENGNHFWIPNDPGNSDYQKYLASLDEATTK